MEIIIEVYVTLLILKEKLYNVMQEYGVIF